jgi:hypothetical protein
MVCSYVITRHVFENITKALGATRLLALAKASNGIQPIEVGEVFYQLMYMTLCLQFRDAFLAHLSPHQVGVTVRGGCDMVVHGIQAP